MDPSDANYFRKQAQEEARRWANAGKGIPTQDNIDEAAALLGRRRAAGDTGPLSPALLPPGIATHTFSNGVAMVYWAGDPRVKTVINVPRAELPKFLVHQDPDVRTLAKWCLDT